MGSAPDFRYTTCVANAPGCPIVRRILVRGLTWPLPVPLLTYYDNTGASLPPALGGLLSAVQLPTVDAIDITLPVRTPSRYTTGPMTVTGRVSLPNAGINLLSVLGP